MRSSAHAENNYTENCTNYMQRILGFSGNPIYAWIVDKEKKDAIATTGMSCMCVGKQQLRAEENTRQALKGVKGVTLVELHGL